MCIQYLTRTTPPTCWKGSALVACFVLLAVGCRSGMYNANDLPANFVAPANRGAGDLDLTKFSRPVANTDVVSSGDVLEVSIATGLETKFPPKYTLRVDDQGNIMVPLIGPVRLAGLQLSDADRAVYDAAVSRGLYKNPNVSVTMENQRTHRIVVAGAVKNPGTYNLPATNSDVLTALVAAGGLLQESDTRIEVRQSSQQNISRSPSNPERFASYREGEEPGLSDMRTVELDLAQAQHVNDWDVLLRDGAVVTVRERPPQTVAVMGKVRKPGQFDMPDSGEFRLLDAVALAGGRSLSVADKIYVVRSIEGAEEPILIRASVRSAKADPSANMLLAAGDVVSVEDTPLTMSVEAITRMIHLGLSTPLGF